MEMADQTGCAKSTGVSVQNQAEDLHKLEPKLPPGHCSDPPHFYYATPWILSVGASCRRKHKRLDGVNSANCAAHGDTHRRGPSTLKRNRARQVLSGGRHYSPKHREKKINWEADQKYYIPSFMPQLSSVRIASVTATAASLDHYDPGIITGARSNVYEGQHRKAYSRREVSND